MSVLTAAVFDECGNVVDTFVYSKEELTTRVRIMEMMELSDSNSAAFPINPQTGNYYPIPISDRCNFHA